MQVTRQLAGVEAQLATAIETYLDHQSQAGRHGKFDPVCFSPRPDKYLIKRRSSESSHIGLFFKILWQLKHSG